MKKYTVTLMGVYDAEETSLHLEAYNEEHARRKATMKMGILDIIVSVQEVENHD